MYPVEHSVCLASKESCHVQENNESGNKGGFHSDNPN